MRSKVYFVEVKDSGDIRGALAKLSKLLDESKVLDFIRKSDRLAVKIHFGEEGNTSFVNPQFTRIICEEAKKRCASSFLSDTNTLYRGKRLNCKDHLNTAASHGFTKESMGIDIVIPDDSKKENIAVVDINGKFVKSAKIARPFNDADAILAVNHFKGHILTGFGGAIKNIGMGCATREGKLAQHCDISPVINPDECIGCGECEKVCPAGAITIENKKSVITKSKCIGCASCIAACPTEAMFIDFGSGVETQQKMAEYALAALKDKKERSAFINFAVRIKQECDCWHHDTPTIAPDIGIFASTDPVSIDKASFDMTVKICGKDVFKEAHAGTDGMKQLEYADSIGLGNLDYELIKI